MPADDDCQLAFVVEPVRNPRNPQRTAVSDLADGRTEEEPRILGRLGLGAAPRCDLVGVAARVEPDADDVHGVGNGWQQFHCVEGDVGVVAAVGASGLGPELEQRHARTARPSAR